MRVASAGRGTGHEGRRVPHPTCRCRSLTSALLCLALAVPHTCGEGDSHRHPDHVAACVRFSKPQVVAGRTTELAITAVGLVQGVTYRLVVSVARGGSTVFSREMSVTWSRGGSTTSGDVHVFAHTLPPLPSGPHTVRATLLDANAIQDQDPVLASMVQRLDPTEDGDHAEVRDESEASTWKRKQSARRRGSSPPVCLLAYPGSGERLVRLILELLSLRPTKGLSHSAEHRPICSLLDEMQTHLDADGSHESDEEESHARVRLVENLSKVKCDNATPAIALAMSLSASSLSREAVDSAASQVSAGLEAASSKSKDYDDRSIGKDTEPTCHALIYVGRDVRHSILQRLGVDGFSSRYGLEQEKHLNDTEYFLAHPGPKTAIDLDHLRYPDAVGKVVVQLSLVLEKSQEAPAALNDTIEAVTKTVAPLLSIILAASTITSGGKADGEHWQRRGGIGRSWGPHGGIPSWLRFLLTETGNGVKGEQGLADAGLDWDGEREWGNLPSEQRHEFEHAWAVRKARRRWLTAQDVWPWVREWERPLAAFAADVFEAVGGM